MVARDGTVTVKITGDAKGLNDALDTSDGHLDRFGGKMGTVAKGVGLAFAAMTAAAVPFAIKAVSLASDAEESLSKVNTIFGKSAGVIEKWASGAAEDIGLSRGAALTAAGDFGNMFTQLGIGTEKAAGMSTGIVTLAADFASFHNADISEVIASQSAAFRGEYDSLQKFLPLINAATVEQEALKMTGKATTKELTAQDKALAVNALMLSGAGKAAGDFDRTSGGLANQLRILKARGEDFLVKVGSALLPIVLRGIELFGKLGGILKDVLAPVFDTIKGGVMAFAGAWKAADGDVTSSGFAGFMEKLANAIRLQVIPAFERIVEVAQPVVSFLKDNMVAVIAGLTVGVIAFAVAMAAATPPVVAVATATGVALAPILAIAAGIAILVAGVIYAYKNFEGFRDVVDKVAAVVSNAVGSFIGYAIDQFGNLVDWVKQFWPQISEAVSHVMNVVAGIIRTALDVVSALWRAWGDDLFRVVLTIWNYIRETIENAIQLIKGIIQTVVAIINGDWGKAWDGIKNIVGAVWDQIGNIISTAIGVLKGLLGGLVSTVGEMALGLWQPIADKMTDAKNWVSDRIGDIVRFFTDMPGRLVTAAGDLFGFVKTKIDDAKQWVSDRLGDVVTYFVEFPGNLARGAGEIFEFVKTKMTDAKDWIWNRLGDIVGFFTGMPGRITNAVAGMFDGIKGAFKTALNGVIGMWNDLRIPGFTFGGWDTPFGKTPSFTTPTINFPDISPLAAGGIVTRPTLAMIGEAGPEAVIPLSRMGSGGRTVNHYEIVVTAIDPAAASEAVITAIKEYERRNGTDWRVA